MACMRACMVAALLVPPAAVGADAPSASVAPRCESSAAGREKLDVACSLRASATTPRYRFTAHFSGSHDDTRLSMSVTLDGAPLNCEPGSITSLEGEDGDVTLHCIVPAALGPADTTRVLRVRLSWWHALYTHFELNSVTP